LTYFTEIRWEKHAGGLISGVEAGGVAHQSGIQGGDELLAIGGIKVDDVIDVNFYGAEENLEFLIRRDSEYLIIETERSYGQSLGLEFEHPTFDTDIHRCNNLCEFCFVLQMAPRFRRTLYIKDDDYRYSFLFGHFVTLTNLTDHDWWRIETMRLSPLFVSVHVTDTDMRRKFLRNEKAPNIMEQLAWLADKGIDIHTQIVVVPEFNDGPWLEKSIDELAELWPSVKSISVVPVGLTSFHKYSMRGHTKQEASQTVHYLEALQKKYYSQLGINFVYPTDEWYLVAGESIPPQEAYDGQQLQENGLGMVRDFLEEWKALRREIRSRFKNEGARSAFGEALPYSSITLVTGTLFSSTLAEVAAEFADLVELDVSVRAIDNNTLGHSITVAGLLMAADIVDQLQSLEAGSLVVLPSKAFDHPQMISLDDVSPQEVADRLQVSVALAESMGDVWDALIGNSSLLYPAPTSD
jgi:putative radical SAM enzyme (TIGR03279 family)